MLKKILLIFSIIFAVFLLITKTLLYTKEAPNLNKQTYDKSIVHTLLKNDTRNNYFFKEPKTVPSSTSIKIFKASRTLELYGDDKLIGKFKIALGQNPVGNKNKEGDFKTPEGKYYICTRNAKSKFTLFLGLSYPNIEDAKRGLDNATIDLSTYNKIKKSIENKQQPNWNSALGGAVGIHGGGNTSDRTAGCIALSNEDIHLLWKYTKYGTDVEIFQ